MPDSKLHSISHTPAVLAERGDNQTSPFILANTSKLL
jgi:hypothetical protein